MPKQKCVAAADLKLFKTFWRFWSWTFWKVGRVSIVSTVSAMSKFSTNLTWNLPSGRNTLDGTDCGKLLKMLLVDRSVSLQPRYCETSLLSLINPSATLLSRSYSTRSLLVSELWVAITTREQYKYRMRSVSILSSNLFPPKIQII